MLAIVEILLTRFGKNSTNSSIPPSQDPNRKKTTKPDEAKNRRSRAINQPTIYSHSQSAMSAFGYGAGKVIAVPSVGFGGIFRPQAVKEKQTGSKT